jgi:hypothetical protein
MKRFLAGLFVGLLIGFVAIQFYRPERTNPRMDPKNAIESSVPVPPHVTAILERSCNDCHSSKTVWPWYSKVAPVSWYLVDHVREGRNELSFSQWGTYSTRKKDRKLEEICGEVKNGKMPLPSYIRLHPEARLSSADVKTLCDWTVSARAALAESSRTTATAAPPASAP